MKRFLLRAGALIAISAVLITLLFGVLTLYVNKQVNYELDEELFNRAGEESTTHYYAYDKNNRLCEIWKSFSNGKREWVELSDVSEYLVKGFISIEDREFYSHKGINVRRTFAAVINHIFRFRDSFGASTITQQVVKNISGDNETTIKRKINELFRAMYLERNHSKDEILELYLNIVPMSENMYGVSVAAEAYFGKEASELTIAEAAMLIGITNAPTKYSPYSNPEACLAKRNRVLKAMYENAVIDEGEYKTAIESDLGVGDNPQLPGISSWFIETAKSDIINDLIKKYDISEPAAKLMLNGSKVILTMSPEIQRIMEDYFGNTENLSDKFLEGMNYSMVVSDPATGNLLGIVGNGGVKKGELLYNYATAPIIPGSTLKPLAIYAPLIDSGDINWSYIVDDEPIRYSTTDSGEEIPYPKNSPDVYDGLITVSEAIKKSKNTVALRLLEMIGAEKAFNTLKYSFGFENLVEKEILSNGSVRTDIAEAPLALGQLTRGVSLRRITESYNVFPNGGVLSKGNSYYGVFDRDGRVIIEAENSEKTLFKKSTADIMNQLLMNVVKDGTARQIALEEIVDTAGKTGTSGGDKDRLFVGYTPYFTAGIWCGFSDGRNVGFNSPNHLQIWDKVMTEIHNSMVLNGYVEEIEGFDTSELMLRPYCSASGGIPNEDCELYDDSFIEYGYYSLNDRLIDKCDMH